MPRISGSASCSGAIAVGLVAVVLVRTVPARQAAPDPGRFEADIAVFEAEDRARPPLPGGVLFVGSSSIRYWDLAKAFPGRRAIKRGFGGSHVSDTLHFAERIVVPYRPALIVFYAGDADVAGGKSAEQIAMDYRALLALIRAKLPEARTIVIGTKPSPAHWSHMATIRAANAAARALAAAEPLVDFVDVEAALLGPDGRPRADYYAENGLNLNERGYDAWNAAVRPAIERYWPHLTGKGPHADLFRITWPRPAQAGLPSAAAPVRVPIATRKSGP